MTHEQLPPQPAEPAPAMQLLDGDATQAPAAPASRLVKIARGAMYGAVLLAATALLAVSAVPELANYASFVPEKNSGACHAALAGSHCTTLDKVNFAATPCAAAAMARFDCDKLQSGGCCAGSAESAATEASLVAASTSECAGSGCPLGCAVVADDEPIDAGSLLAAADEPADQQPVQDQAELTPDENVVEE